MAKYPDSRVSGCPIDRESEWPDSSTSLRSNLGPLRAFRPTGGKEDYPPYFNESPLSP